jgi:ATP-dependent DNA ligase
VRHASSGTQRGAVLPPLEGLAATPRGLGRKKASVSLAKGKKRTPAPPRPEKQSGVKKRGIFAAMEARSVEDMPIGEEWQYEPKWDGFRCLLKRDAEAVTMYSKSGQDLNRYAFIPLRAA